MIRWLPHDSATVRDVNPDWEWTLGAHLAAAQVDALNAQIWQAGGGKGKRPKPIPRPGTKGFTGEGVDAAAAALQLGSEGSTRFGTAVDLDEMATRLGLSDEMAEAAELIQRRLMGESA